MDTLFLEYLDAEAASLFLLENRDSEIVCRVSVGASDITGLRLKYGQGIVGQSIAEQASLMVRDVRDDPRFNRAMSLSLLKFVGQASLVDEAMLPS